MEQMRGELQLLKENIPLPGSGCGGSISAMVHFPRCLLSLDRGELPLANIRCNISLACVPGVDRSAQKINSLSFPSHSSFPPHFCSYVAGLASVHASTHS